MGRRIATVVTGLSLALICSLTVGCINGPAVLTQQVEARRLAGELHVQFATATDASNRAVLADTDDLSTAAAHEADEAKKALQQTLDSLRPILKDLGYQDEIEALRLFEGKYKEYRQLDGEILPLAVENTNLKAQRLSFDPAQQSVQAFRREIEQAVSTTGSAGALPMRAVAALLEIQVIQARHIAEADESVMTGLEMQITDLQKSVRRTMDELKGKLPAASQPRLAAAADAFARFNEVNEEIVKLSRRNSNVRSLALSLGRKRVVAAECDDQLRALQDALGKHEFAATR